MPFRSSTVRFRAALIALIAILAATAMPVASQLLRSSAHSQVFPAAEICSAISQTPLPDSPRESTPSGMVACASCTLQADHPVMLSPAAVSVSAEAQLSNNYPDLYYQSLHGLAPWSTGSPRGPPAQP
jgi:hypothetical protein